MLVLRSTGAPVRPHVGAEASLGRVRSGRTRPGAKLAAQPAAAGPPQAATPAYLEQAYDLAYLSQTGGSADTVAIVDAYDDPTAEADLAVYRSTYGLPACTSQSGCFKKVNENGATSPLPGADASWDSEISIDLDAVSAVCPHCHILLVEAASSYDSDLDAGVQTAASMGANQISASWTFTSSGIPSGSYTFPGIATVAATGDQGYVGPGEDDYPAAFPGVTAAGGTTLTPATSAGARGFSEGAWSGGGSGCDVNFPQPSYQTNAGCAGRAYADLSADGDPSTGLNVYNNGAWGVVGGTSLATPLIAAYYAITGAPAATPQWAYTNSAQLNDVVTGSTGSCAAGISYICDAGVGYDGPTGVGSISGAAATGAPGIGGPSIGSGSQNTYTQGVGSRGATIAGGIYQNGLNTTWWIQYGTTSAYGSQTAPADLGAGSAPVAVTGYLSGLAPATTYHYRLVAENSLGTTYGYDYTFTTAAAPDTAPTASFSDSPSAPFPGGRVAFDASGSTGGSGPAITDYQWNFGDGTAVVDTGTAASASHRFTRRGTYPVTLTVTSAAGSDSTTQTVTVDDPPTATFTPSGSVAAPDATVSFDASASGPGDPGGTITDYSWNFGDGTPVDDTGDSADATHAFASPGIYTVALTTTDDLGVSTTATRQVTVDTPAAAVTISPATVVAPGTAVSFDATGSTDPEGTIIDYSWSFGDGTPIDDAGTSTSIQRAYATRGTYTVTLTVTNNFGQTNTTTHTITVDDPPTAVFTSSPPSVAAPGATVNFDASASAPGASGGTINDYSWNFGDGTPVDDTSATAAASHAYATPGTYTVTLTTTDDLGVTGTTTEQITVDAPTAAFTISPNTPAPGSSVSFDASGSTDPEGTITDYRWNLGNDYSVDTGSSPSLQRWFWHRGVRTVTLTVRNNHGQTSTVTHTLTIDDPPTAAFTSSPPSVAAPGATVNFDASASAPGASGGTINDYSWNFGDGTPVDDTSATAAASHAYATPGTYTVTLTTTDDLGVTGTTTEQITVDAPTAAFTISPNTPAPGSSVSFDASGSTDPEGTIGDYSWNFGDGTPVQDAGGGAAVQHTFASRGSYTVALTVTNNYGQTSTSTHAVTVDDPPTATFAPSATVIAPGATVNFEASASAPGGPDGAITAYSWNFGDGSAVAAGGGSADASHTFASPGTYTVTLTTTDDLGVSTTTTEQITVSAPTPPPGVITVTPTPPVPTPTPAPSPSPPATTPQPMTAALAAAKRQRLAAATAHGLRIQLSTNASSTVGFQIAIPRSETRQGTGLGRTQRPNRKPVVLLQTAGRGFGGGTYTIMLKLSKAAVRELSGAGPLQVTIRITVVGANGTKLTRSASITLQR
jgi:PKD repeat protein